MDCLQEWPEPVVRVQSLSDSGAAVIPDRYIKPPSERPYVNDVGGKLDITHADNLINIPVVDLNCEETVHAVSEACRSWGFFQAVNHKVSPELMRRAREDWREFFHLPMEEKQLYANSPKTYEGYGSRLGIQKGAILDWGDYYFLHLVPLCLKNHGKWPASPPTLRETVDEYSHELLRLCHRVIKVLSMGLGLDEECLLSAFGGDDSGACMRVNFYPKCPQPSLTLGLSSHSDPGGITVLLPDDRVKGLQVRYQDAWITVEPLPDAFIINIGDQVQILSNATYKSVEHRVMVNSHMERLSIAFFYNPKSDLPLAPVSELVTLEKPALYQAMTFDQYRLYIRQRGPKGKSQVESLKNI
ncbi:putative 2-oxoglutarate-dependent dioxygenase ANS [Iris pallida]|uniref:2-oxoglutarate-dependent dioxygenase ANS n=1 Tax=Iris pallida TaxID=29817 RepID=A0AAX6HAN5_IRIPA|nr:putative 2-oxoglutarate-dependent dioxygenase ANS [Iris pallida]